MSPQCFAKIKIKPETTKRFNFEQLNIHEMKYFLKINGKYFCVSSESIIFVYNLV